MKIIKDINKNEERKNYCYFNILKEYYKHVLYVDENEEINNCFINNQNSDILMCLYNKNEELNLSEKLLFKIYPIKRFILEEYINKYEIF